MFAALKAWRRRRILTRHGIPDALWAAALERLPFLARLSAEERARLREQVVLFLHDKQVNGAGGLVVDDFMRVVIAAQACILTLNIGLDWYRGWVEIIVYPDEFVPEYEYEDEDGLIHRIREPRSGEAWPGGPLILSWADAAGDHGMGGYNVVIHEFAHKLDMKNGDANGCPPLPEDISRREWAHAFGSAYADFCARVDTDQHTNIDPYAAESPGEFFAVASEVFFVAPAVLAADYPAVYVLLKRFYRQDPLAAFTRAARTSETRN